jgi:hypothetical protein
VSFNYIRTAATSLRLLTKFGQEVTRRAVTVGAYNPATGAAAVTTADTTRKGVILTFGAGATEIRGELVQTNDRQLMLDAEGPALVTDRFVVGSVEYSVVSVGEIAPSGVAVLYDIHLRAGA